MLGSAAEPNRLFANWCETKAAVSLAVAENSAHSPVTRSSFEPLGVSFDRVTKRYGALFALRNLSLTIGPGEFVALLGPNGSGKSSLLKAAATIIRPTSGAVSFHFPRGVPVENLLEARARIGLVGHSSLTYDDLTAEENLSLFAKLYGVENPRARIDELVAAVGLEERRNSLVRTFSRGMRQRLSIARALLPTPGLLLLDEPATGLDTVATDWLIHCIRNLHSTGCTMVMSTHGASDALSLASRTVTLAAGAVASDVAAGPQGGKR